LRTDVFVASLSLELPSDGWLSAAPGQRDGVTLVPRWLTEDPFNVVVYAPKTLFTAAGGLTPIRTRADALAALRERPDLTVGAPRRVVVAGTPATEVEVTASAPRRIKGLCATPCSILFPLGQGLTIDMRAGERLRVRLLEHDGSVLVVWYTLGPLGDARYRAEAEQIVDSIRFEAE
jgi:hypothetical protein